MVNTKDDFDQANTFPEVLYKYLWCPVTISVVLQELYVMIGEHTALGLEGP